MGNSLARDGLARAAACLGGRLGERLPSLVFLTDDDRIPDPMPAMRMLPRGSLIILRARQRPKRVVLAAAISLVARQRDLYWLVAGDPELAVEACADGVHFPEARIAEAHHWRALRSGWFITCAAHSLNACVRIARAGANAALLAPVFPTESHIDGKTLGPVHVRVVAQQSPVPVYALGGVDNRTARRLRGASLAGLAAVCALTL